MAFYNREVVALMRLVPGLGASNPMGLIVKRGHWWCVVHREQ